jgi:hypothetical protein
VSAVITLAVAGLLAVVAGGLWWRERRQQPLHAAWLQQVHDEDPEISELESWLRLPAVTPEHERRA